MTLPFAHVYAYPDGGGHSQSPWKTSGEDGERTQDGQNRLEQEVRPEPERHMRWTVLGATRKNMAPTCAADKCAADRVAISFFFVEKKKEKRLFPC
jgi:hypothetical protein